MHETDCNPALKALIRQRLETTGGITFAEFMGLCLYHPQHGYYMAARERIGKGGDFFTSTSVHSLFGALLARQLEQMWQILGGGAFTVAEQGAGEGHLCLDILNAAAARPEFYRQIRYRLVEISPENRRRQQQLLAPHAEKVDWCSVEELHGMEGCFLSNELLDAFPVHLVEKRDGRIFEVFVKLRDGEIAEDLRPPSNPGILDYFHRAGVEPVEGNRAEVNLAAVDWMQQVGRILRRGFVLTIDYGYPTAELYAPFRRDGTLMCYSRHQAGENPYLRIGCQDLTAHVDFGTVQRAGEEQGLFTLFFGEQYRFLLALGFVEALVELQAQVATEKEARALRLTLKNLILPDGGMGETFKVLVQGKDVGRPQLLCQRRIQDLPLPVG